MAFKIYWILEITVISLSITILFSIGIYWLYTCGLLWIWLSVSLVIIAASILVEWCLNNWIDNGKKTNKQEENIESKIEHVMHDLQEMSDTLKQSNPDFYGIEFYVNTLYNVMKTVAKRFYPGQKQAYLEINIPYFLKVVELIAHDIRLSLSNTIPGSHILSFRQIISIQRHANEGMQLYGFFRNLAQGTALDPGLIVNIKNSSKIELKNWLIDFYVQKIGSYAIELYSGKHRLDDDPALFLSGLPQKEYELKVDYTAPAIVEPLRILVLGQTGSGKSSCINALFGKLKSRADVIPITKGITAFLLRRSELEKSIILDSEGYGYDSESLIAGASQEILRCDMILLVVSAINAARINDSNVIKQIKACYAKLPNKPQPPIVVALTHIDQLRPWREWHPPYNIAEPNNAKALNIRTAMQMVAEDLQIDLDQIAPICIKPGQEYNLAEGLIPTILQHLDRAKQLRYLRCINHYQKEDYWRRLWLQSKNAGRFIAREAYRLTI